MAEIKAIVYESNTGFTKKYAELLSEELEKLSPDKKKIPAIPVTDNSMIFGEREPVIFLGWICAGKINGIRMARLKYNPVIIAGVGMTLPSELYAYRLAQQNNIDVPFFYLQGGIHPKELKGFYKLMFNLGVRPLLRKAEKGRSQLSEGKKRLVDLIKNGGEFVDSKNLDDIVAMYKKISEVLKDE